MFLLLYNNFIPISLYVTIELVNVGQAYLIASDAELYDEELDCPCVVRSSNLVQELGMVSNIFSDKTGTLTRNEMKLVKFLVNGVLYDVPQGDNSTTENTEIRSVSPTQSPHSSGASLSSVHMTLKAGGTQCVALMKFLRCLSTCHTVVRGKDGKYRAESPDELALVEGVMPFDCSLVERSTALMTVTLAGNQQAFEILAVNAFNSDRKRMSVLLRDTVSGQYIALCKGADNIMMPLCNISDAHKASISASLLDLARMGLRTLCVAERVLDNAAAGEWLAKYRAAASSITNRAESMAAAAAELELGMELVGITAIEDRLQDEVPEVIADLAKAGIILWMLTGDKEETAIQIGISCNLLLDDTKLFFLTRITSAEAYNNALQGVYDDILSHTVEGKGYVVDSNIVEIALVMDGPSFKFFDDTNPNQRQWLLYVGKACRSVVACRLTPIQKQQVVGLVKKDSVPTAITLSIGDGANDVSMIREANVGVGIFGKEGRQAANNADFAIGQFKFLRKLLLVHGRWNYNRQSRVFLYSMHKNMVLTLSLFWYR